LAVLELLARKDMYGYELAEALDDASEGVLAMGHSTLYPMLYNLEGKGWVAPERVRSGQGRARKYYRITADGRAALAESRSEWRSLVEAMARLQSPHAEVGE